MGSDDLCARYERVGTTGRLLLHGDLDIGTAPQLRTALLDALAAVPTPALVIVDVAEVRFCGVRAVTVLLDVAVDVPLVLARRPAFLRRLMSVLDLEQSPHPVPDDPDAVQLCPRPGPLLR